MEYLSFGKQVSKFNFGSSASMQKLSACAKFLAAYRQPSIADRQQVIACKQQITASWQKASAEAKPIKNLMQFNINLNQ